MKKVAIALKKGFESSSGLTPEFASFFRLFKSEITKVWKELGAVKIEVNRGHFYSYGFAELADHRIYYFNLGDVRGGGSMFIRTATSFKDFTGGRNEWASVENFKQDVEKIIRRDYEKT